jgi:hypothetical protein
VVGEATDGGTASVVTIGATVSGTKMGATVTPM